MKERYFLTLFAFVTLFFVTTNVAAHCEIPCGIYDDEMRLKQISEHIRTIEKSMTKIRELERAETVNYNQLTRWTMNKEHHAEELQKIVTQYFMTQRIKPDQRKYERKVGLLHKMLISAMKCKQTTKVEHVNKLKDLLSKFRKVYFAKKQKKLRGEKK